MKAEILREFLRQGRLVASVLPRVEGEVSAPVTAVSLPARGRPPEAAARSAGLEPVEKVLTGGKTCCVLLRVMLDRSAAADA
jgi:hypothetical protein